MNKIQALFIHKPPSFNSNPSMKQVYIVDAVELSPGDFFSFCNRPSSQNYAFLQDYNGQLHSGPGTEYCLLVTSPKHQDAVLVQSDGYDCARHAAYMSGGSVYLHGLVDMICRDITEQLDDELSLAGRVTFEHLENNYSLVLDVNSNLTHLISEKLAQHPAVEDVELDEDGLTVAHRQQTSATTHPTRLKNLLLLGLPPSTYLLHLDADLGFVPVGGESLETLPAEVLEKFAPLLDATVEKIEPHAYGRCITLGDVDPTYLADFDRYQANSMEAPTDHTQ